MSIGEFHANNIENIFLFFTWEVYCGEVQRQPLSEIRRKKNRKHFQ